MGELLTRRRGLILQSGGAEASPLYPLDGTYSIGGSNKVVVTDHSHWVMTGSGAVQEKTIYSYPSSLFMNKDITFKAVISNLQIRKASGTGKKIRLGSTGSSHAIDLFEISSGDGTYTVQYKFIYGYQNLIRLFAHFNWSSSFDFEFDFKLYADDVWIS